MLLPQINIYGAKNDNFDLPYLHIMTFPSYNLQSKHCLMALRVVSRGFLWPVFIEESRQVFVEKVSPEVKINTSEVLVREEYNQYGK